MPVALASCGVTSKQSDWVNCLAGSRSLLGAASNRAPSLFVVTGCYWLNRPPVLINADSQPMCTGKYPAETIFGVVSG